MYERYSYSCAESDFLYFKRIKSLSLPIDMKLTLFDSKVITILLYGCEAWEEKISI